MTGTNAQRLGKKVKTRKATKGRPKVDRDLIIRNMKLIDNNGARRYTDTQLASMAGCTARTIRNIRQEALEKGLITEEENQATKGIGIVEADFDKECERANGYSFSSWLDTRFKNGKRTPTVMNFTTKVWEQLWDKCSMVEFRDRDQQLADICAQKFVNEFNDDPTRMRSRLKTIRYIFRFFGRLDVCSRHLTMSNDKHPRSKRKVPQITELGFGSKWHIIENMVEAELGPEAVLMLRFKICSQMRTGEPSDERELFGIKKGYEGKSYITFDDDRLISHIFAKKSEEWDIIWLPAEVKEAMKKHLKTVNEGAFIWDTSVKSLRKAFGKATKKVYGKRFILHDTRKISVTWLYCMGVPSEVAVLLNVGWKDLSTAFDHYLDAKRLLRGSYRLDYAGNIPGWFKEGLDDFQGFDAAIPGQKNSAKANIMGVSHF